MAAKITGASLQPILRRMNDAPNYHPFEADAFSDWSMNAGDLITINRGEESYTSPVNVSRMVWKGSAPTVQISSTGNKNREPIAKVSRKKYGRGSAGVRSQERVYHEFTSEDGILHSELEMTESYLRTEFVDYGNSLRGEFEMTASHLRTEFEDGVNSLRGSLEMTASRLRTEFNDDVNSLRGDFEMTASHLRTEFNDDVNSLRGDFEMTASRLRTEFEDDVNSLRGDFEMTASHLRTEFEDGVNSLRGEFEITASRLRTEFEDDVNSLRGEFEMTASRLRTEFEDDVNSLRGDFEMTASHLRTEFGDDVNSLRGDFEMTASHLQTIFENDVNSLRGEFEVTASGLRGEFESGLGSMRGEFQVTASGLRGEFQTGLSSMRGEFEVTASGLRGEFQTGLSSMRGEFEVTASGLRSEFETATGSLRNEFEVTSSSFGTRISKVVDESGNIKTAQICVAINEDNSSQAVIEADKIHLLGQTITNTITSNYIKSKIEDISFLQAHTISLDTALNVGGQFNLLGVNCTSLVSGVKSIRIPDPVNNVYTLQYKTYDDDEWQSAGSFSRATTLTGSWGGTVSAGKSFTVTASPQGNIKAGKVYGEIVPDTSDPVEYTVDGNNHYVARDYIIYSEDENGDADVQILKKEVKISADLAYSDGYTTGYSDGSASGGSTTLTNTWNNGHIQVTANPQGTVWDEWLSSGTPTVSGTFVSIPINALFGNSQQYSESTGWSASANISSLLQSKTVTSNGTVTPSSGYIGLSSVTVNVPATNARAHFGVASGQYFIEAVDTVSGNQIPGSTVNYSLTVSGRNVTISAGSGQTVPSIALGINTGSLSSGSRTLTVTAGGSNTTATATITDYTSGWNAAVDKVVLPAEGSSSQCTFKVPGSTLGSQASHIYHLANDGNNAVKLYITENNESTTVATLTHNKWYAGKAAVTLADPTWNAITGSTPDHRTVTVSTVSRTNSSGTTENLSKSVALYVTQGGWAGNSSDVFVRTGSTSGTVVAMLTVNATNRFTAGKNSAKVTGPTWTTAPSSDITGNSNTATFTTDADSPVSGASKSLALYMTQDGDWSSNKKYVYVHHTNSTDANRIARVQVNASTLVTNAGYAGRAAVTISSTLTWTTTPASGISVNQNAVTVKTSGRTNSSGTASESEKTINLYSQVGSWGTPATNKCYVYVTHTDSAEGHRILRREVDASRIYTNGYDSAKLTLSNKKITKTSSGSITEYTLALAVDSRNTTAGSDYGKRKVWIKATPNSGDAVEVASTTLSDYREGWTAAYGKVTVPNTESTSSNYMTVKTPPSDVGGSYTSTKYYVTSDNNYVYLRNGSTAGTIVARGTNNAYGNGWHAFYQAHHWPSSGSTDTITVSIPSNTAGSSWDSEQRKYVLQNKDNNTVYLRYNNVTYAEFAHNKYDAGVIYGKAHADHAVTGFGTTGNSGYTYTISGTSYTNNSKGYVVLNENGANSSIAVIVRAAWKCDGISKEAYNYVQMAPTNIWKDAYAEGKANASHTISSFSSTSPIGASVIVNGTTYTNSSSLYAKSGSGANATVIIVTGGSWKCDGISRTQNAYNYLRTGPTNIWKDAYAEGVSAGASSAPHTITEYSTTSPLNASVTVSGTVYTNSSKLYAKSGNGRDATVIIVTGGSWKCDGKSRTQNAYNYLRTGPTNIWKDAYDTGYDANHSLFIGDTNYAAKPNEISISIGSPQEVWAYFQKSDGSTYQWSSKYTLKAVNPWPKSATLYCSEITTGSTGVRTVRLTVQYSASQSVPFSVGKNYAVHWN